MRNIEANEYYTLYILIMKHTMIDINYNLIFIHLTTAVLFYNN